MENKNKYIFVGIGAIVIGGIVYFIVRANKKKKAFDIEPAFSTNTGNSTSTGSLNQQKTETVIIDASVDNAFDPKWYKTLPTSGLYLLKSDAANTLAVQLNEAMSKLNTDEDFIYKTLTDVLTKARVSQIAERYQSLYSKSLQAEIKKKLTSSEYDKAYTIVKGLRVK